MPPNFFMIQRALSIVYDAVVPGSSIPEWFTHKSVGCSVTVEAPRLWSCTRLMGFAFCFVSRPNISMGKLGRSAYFSVNDSGGFSLDNTAPMHFSKADHIRFGYRSLISANFHPSIDNMKVSFFVSNDAGVVVKECGARLVFEQDVLGNPSFPLAPCGWEEEMNDVSFRKCYATYL